MKTNKKWTKDEELVLLGQVKSFPENLTHAFLCASQLLENRSPKACSYRWYKYISKEENNENVCFVTISKKKLGKNRKNCAVSIKPKESKWKQIIRILFS